MVGDKHYDIRNIGAKEQQSNHNEHHRDNLPDNAANFRFAKPGYNEKQHTERRSREPDHHIQADHNAEVHKINAKCFDNRQHHRDENELNGRDIQHTAEEQEHNVDDKKEQVLIGRNACNKSGNRIRNLFQCNNLGKEVGCAAECCKCCSVCCSLLQYGGKAFPSKRPVNQCTNQKCIGRSYSTGFRRCADAETDASDDDDREAQGQQRRTQAHVFAVPYHREAV